MLRRCSLSVISTYLISHSSPLDRVPTRRQTGEKLGAALMGVSAAFWERNLCSIVHLRSTNFDRNTVGYLLKFWKFEGRGRVRSQYILKGIQPFTQIPCFRVPSFPNQGSDISRTDQPWMRIPMTLELCNSIRSLAHSSVLSAFPLQKGRIFFFESYKWGFLLSHLVFSCLLTILSFSLSLYVA